MSNPEAEFEKYKGAIIDKVLREELAVDAFHNIFINVLELRVEQSEAIAGKSNDFFRKIVGGVVDILLSGPRVKISVKDSDLKKKVANHANSLLFSKGGESLVVDAPVSSLVEEAKTIFDKIRRGHGKLPIDVDPYMKRMFGMGMAIFLGRIGQVVEMQLNNLNPELLRLTPEEVVEEMRRMAQEHGDKIQVAGTDGGDIDRAVDDTAQKLVDDIERKKKKQN